MMVVFRPWGLEQWDRGVSRKGGKKVKGQEAGTGRLVGRVVGFVGGWLQLVMSRCLC